MKKNKKFNSLAVVLVNYNGLSDTLKCLASLKKQTAKDFLTIVVDNASKEDTNKITKKYPKAVFIKRETNTGWAGGNNTGIKHALKAGCKNIVLLNNDTFVSKKFVEHMILAAENYPEFGILGPLIYSMEKPKEVMTEGCLYNRPRYNGFFKSQHVPVKISNPQSIKETEIVNGCCLMVRKEVIDQIGLIDERFFYLCEESDFCLRTLQKGWKCGVIAEPLVWHKGSAAFRRPGYNLKNYYNSRNLWLLLKKNAGKTKKARGWLGSRIQYLNTTRYMYSDALEKGLRNYADPVIDGVTDAWTRRYGIKKDIRNKLIRRFVALWLNLNFLIAKTLRN